MSLRDKGRRTKRETISVRIPVAFAFQSAATFLRIATLGGFAASGVAADKNVRQECPRAVPRASSSLAAKRHVVIYVQQVEPISYILAFGSDLTMELMEVIAGFNIGWCALFRVS